VEFDMIYGAGISKIGELIDLGEAAGVVQKSGAWFSAQGQRIGQGRENAKQFLKDNPALADSIEAYIRQNAGLVAENLIAEPTSAEAAEANEGGGLGGGAAGGGAEEL
jgi:recombination protein RecA